MATMKAKLKTNREARGPRIDQARQRYYDANLAWWAATRAKMDGRVSGVNYAASIARDARDAAWALLEELDAPETF